MFSLSEWHHFQNSSQIIWGWNLCQCPMQYFDMYNLLGTNNLHYCLKSSKLYLPLNLKHEADFCDQNRSRNSQLPKSELHLSRKCQFGFIAENPSCICRENLNSALYHQNPSCSIRKFSTRIIHSPVIRVGSLPTRITGLRDWKSLVAYVTGNRWSLFFLMWNTRVASFVAVTAL